MRRLRTAVLAGVAALALAAAPGLARADNPSPHVMTIHLPDGSVAQIHYAGDVAPRVVFAPAASVPAMPMPVLPAAFGPGSPFAMLERLSAAMDREAAALMQQASAAFAAPMLPFPGAPVPAGLGGGAAGSEAYSFLGSTNGHGACLRSMTITSRGDGAAPRVVSRQSGDCGAVGGAPAQAFENVAPAQARRGDMIRVKYDPVHAPAWLIRPLPAWQG